MIREPRKIFSIFIGTKEYDVYDIDGKEHEGYNDTPKTWWLYYSDRLPATPPIDSEYWQAWDVSINRRLWDIRIKQSNSTKYKWDNINFRNHTHVEMWCNNKLIYSFGTTGTSGGLAYAFSKVQYLQVMLSEHPYNFFEAEKENGRKIWWYGLPGIIKVKSNSWEIGIIPDYTTGISKEEWWKEFKNRRSNLNQVIDKNDIQVFEEEDDNQDYINWGDAFSDAHIDWFRK